MDVKLLNRYKTFSHVQLGYGVIILLIVIAASGVLYQSHRTNALISNLVEVNNAKIKHVILMREVIRLRVMSISNILSTSDPFDRDEEIMRFYNLGAQYASARNMLRALRMDEKETQLFKQISNAVQGAYPITKDLVTRASRHESLEMLQQLEKKAYLKREVLFQYLNELVDYQQENSQQALTTIRELNAHARLVIVSIILLVLIISLFIVAMVSRTVEKKNEQLLKAYKDAHAAMQSKSVFLANMSHEIRTPITAIIGFAESTFFSNQTMEMRQKSIKTIIESGKHLLQIINDVLDISKIEANKLEVETISTPLSNIITSAETILKPLADEKSLDFSINYQYPLPVMLDTDPLRLKQIIINLCSNAIKFTKQGYVQVNVSYRKEDHKLFIEVVDTGIGLDKDQIKAIFEPFNQADASVNRKYGGTGLGLAISTQLVEALHGNITVSSEPGKGSRFTVVMDIGEKTEEQLTYEAIDICTTTDTEKEIKEDIAVVNRMRVKGKVLVVEDNLVNQQLLRVFLDRINADYELVENGQLAVERVQANDFDLILMDIQMPVMDGITATKILREQGYDIPIVALTANFSDEDRQNCYNAGCNNFLTKPINIKIFFEVITDYLHYDADNTDQNEPIYSAFIFQEPELAKQVEGFVKIHMPAMLRDIEQSIQQADWAGLKIKLQELKNIASNVGYPVLIDIAKQMEFQIINQSQDELKLLCDKLTAIAECITLGINTASVKKASNNGNA